MCLALLLLLLVTACAAQAAPQFSPADEQEIVRLVNRERQSRGLATLVSDEGLRNSARKHSELMAATGEVEHRIADEPVLGLRLRAVRFNICGENVAMAVDAARVHDALMHSPGHRANILDPQYNSIGVGVVRTAKGIYVTEDFAHRLPEISVDEAEAQVANGLNRLRRSAGAPMLTRVPAPDLRQRACEMAANDKLDPRTGFSSQVSHSIAFTASDLSQLPDSLTRLRSIPASGFSIGACYRSSASYQNPIFWFLVVTYF